VRTPVWEKGPSGGGEGHRDGEEDAGVGEHAAAGHGERARCARAASAPASCRELRGPSSAADLRWFFVLRNYGDSAGRVDKLDEASE
jgi:hypothetical protein